MVLILTVFRDGISVINSSFINKSLRESIAIQIKELQREKIALRKFQKSIIGIELNSLSNYFGPILNTLPYYSHAIGVLIMGNSNLIRIKAVQKCILNETDLESALADQLSLYIGLNSEINIIKSLEVNESII